LVEPHAVDAHAGADEDRMARRVHELVALVEVVAHRALVVDLADDAVELGAEFVVSGGVREPAREDADIA